MLALKIRERCMAQDIKQAEIMGDAARALVRIQDEMQARIDCALLRQSSSKTNDDCRVAWLESFKLEDGLHAKLEAAERAMDLPASSPAPAGAHAALVVVRMTDLDFLDALKIRERFMAQDIKQAEIMGDAARTLVRIQDEMQARIDCALLRQSSSKTNDDHHVAWLESFKLEDGLRAQVEMAERASRSSRRTGCARRWRWPSAPWAWIGANELQLSRCC
jgi:hypothetical protein